MSDLFNETEYETQISWFKNITTTLETEGLNCANTYCSGYGTCYTQPDLFSSKNFTQFVENPFTKKCLCVSTRQGDDCSEAFSEAAYNREQSESDIYIDWFIVPKSSDQLKLQYNVTFDLTQSNNYYGEYYTPYDATNSSNPTELMVVSQYMTRMSYKEADSKAQSYIPACNRTQCMASKIFSDPLSFVLQSTG